MTCVVALSDTHNLHYSIPQIPDGDILIHCGDITMMGEINILFDFNEWLGKLPHPVKIVIGGNHDITLETQPKSKQILTNAVYLENSAILIDGLKIWGSPFTPSIYATYDEMGYPWVFSKNRGKAMKEIWDKIPKDLDILITHGPPKLILDENTGHESVGC